MKRFFNKNGLWVLVFSVVLFFFFFLLIHPKHWITTTNGEVKLFYVDNISDTHKILIDKFNRENKGKIRVVPVNLPFNKFTTNERKEMLARSLRSKSERIDLFTVDIIWTPRFAKWGAVLDDYYSDSELRAFIPKSLQTCYYNGKLVAVPFYMDVGMLYYEKNVLKTQPDYRKLETQIKNGLTWPQFIAIGKRFDENKRPIFLFPADNFEGLMCVFYETLSQKTIRRMFGQDSVHLDVPQARRGLQLLYDFIHRYRFTPPQVYDFDEINCYNLMLEKNGLFLRGWPGLWLRVNAYNAQHQEKRIVGIAPIPHFKGQQNTAIYGGWNFMIANKSKHKAQAVRFIKFFQRFDNQRLLFTAGGYLPTLSRVYRDSTLLRKHPELSLLRKLLNHGQFRPMRPDYTRISDVMSFYFRKALKGELSVEQALRQAEEAINAQSINLK